MKFIAKDNKTDEEREMTETEVRAEIIDTIQHDMATRLEHSDEEIAERVNSSDILDYFEKVRFEGNTTLEFEGRNFDITRV